MIERRLHRNYPVVIASIQLGLALLGYFLFGLWFAARLSTAQESMNDSIKSLKGDIKSLSERIDRHIDKGK